MDMKWRTKQRRRRGPSRMLQWTLSYAFNHIPTSFLYMLLLDFRTCQFSVLLLLRNPESRMSKAAAKEFIRNERSEEGVCQCVASKSIYREPEFRMNRSTGRVANSAMF